MDSSKSPSPSFSDAEKVADIIHNEDVYPRPSRNPARNLKDAALEILGDGATPIQVNPEEDRKVLRKIDLWLMPVIVVVYFLQQLDKSSLSYASVFDLVQDAHLVGQQYSWLGSIVYVAQLIWQPVSSYLLVRLPVAKYLFVNVFMWGVVVSCTAAGRSFSSLLATRFLLGIFEATVAPCFITITQMWWRRREQTLRLSIWFAANGATGIVGSLIAWGIGHIHGRLFPYQTIFLFIGLLTLVLSPLVWFILPDSPTTARFLNHQEKVIAVERLRANNMGTETKVWKWDHVWDLLRDAKTYCWLPSGGISSFGPLIIKGFGFNQFDTLLFNIPFAALQVLLTVSSAWIATKLKLKWPVLFCLCLPPIAGASALLALGREPELRNKLLGCYYVLSFFSSIQPMLYTWSSQNTAGHTKKLCTTGIVFVAQCVGNIVGPLLYTTEEAPYYRRGLIANLACWIALAILVLFTAAYLQLLNKRHTKARISAGKVGDLVDISLETVKQSAMLQRQKEQDGLAQLNQQAFDDLTDVRNEDFIYVL